MHTQWSRQDPDRSRRTLLSAGMATALLSMLHPLRATATQADSGRTVAPDAIRPFRAHVPQAALVDLRRRLAAARWPGPEAVGDRSQGVQLERIRPLMGYWATSYDWRKATEKLSAWPQFVTNIDHRDIHFIHVRSRHANALPLIMTHGWPGSVFELLNVIGPLTDPTAHGGSADEALHLVIPSVSGFGFSQKPTDTGWHPGRIARGGRNSSHQAGARSQATGSRLSARLR